MRLFFISGAVSCSKKTYYLAQIMEAHHMRNRPKIIYSKSIAFYVKSEMDSNEYDYYVYLTSRF